MNYRVKVYILGISFFLLACANKQREHQLQLREDVLMKKEKEFALKEADYRLLLQMRDSLNAIEADTVAKEYWPDYVLGLWNSKVICTESNCSDYVVGDVRSDQWDFTYDSTRLTMRVGNGGKIIRIYNATYKDSVINLNFNTDSSSKKQVSMNVLLSSISSQKMKGVRTVTVNDNCRAKFSVELAKIESTTE